MPDDRPNLKAISGGENSSQLNSQTAVSPPVTNRNGMIAALSLLVAQSEKGSLSMAVVCIDINDFREINFSSGYEVGDAVLKDVETRLQEALRPGDLLFRTGDDEFTVLLPSILHEDHAILAAHKISSCFEEMVFVSDNEPIDVRVSIGISLFPNTAEDQEELLRQAAIAMYRAKLSKAEFDIYQKVTTPGNVPPLQFVRALRRAVAENDLELYFQPKYRLSDNTIVGVEALCRWTHAKYGVISPADFIPVAEETGIISSLTSWAVNSALRQCSDWQHNGNPLVIAVNLSAYDLGESDFPELVQRALRTWRVPPARLMLEITETAMMRDHKQTIGILRRLSELGVGLSIDDFGSGYSSLNYLQQMPVNELKIEREFVLKMERSENDMALVRTVIDLGHNYGLTVTAEGVENASVGTLLRKMGCDLAQGNYFSPAISVEDLELLLG